MGCRRLPFFVGRAIGVPEGLGHLQDGEKPAPALQGSLPALAVL